MREIKVNSWKVIDSSGKEAEQDLLVAINAIISSLKPAEMPKGIKQFQIFGKISEAFSAAEKTKVLKLEEREYEFLKKIVEDKVPANWALNKNISEAINTFLEAEDNNHINA